MARTVRQLLTDTLRTVGVVGQSATPNATQIGMALNELHNRHRWRYRHATA